MGKKKTKGSELSRILVRDDIEDLRKLVSVYHARDVEAPGYDVVDGSPRNDAELALSISILACAEYDDENFIAFVAAGPLEELLRVNDKELLDRITAEARRFPRFRWMLSGVWPHAIHKDSVDPIQDVLNGMSMDRDPLPPRPNS